jgi:hypothetical protein
MFVLSIACVFVHVFKLLCFVRTGIGFERYAVSILTTSFHNKNKKKYITKFSRSDIYNFHYAISGYNKNELSGVNILHERKTYSKSGISEQIFSVSCPFCEY